jgi:tRNA(Ile)-lysidine synthase
MKDFPLALACSGGSDSVALVHLLKKSGMKKVTLLHFNHQLRELHADQDELFVKNLAKQLGFNFHSSSKDIKKLANKYKESIEACARRERYAWFHQICKKLNIEFLYLGHHNQDQAETLLLNFIRGSGLEGLSGMQTITKEKELYLVRPLLTISKEKILGYLNQNKISYQEDHTNTDITFWRNRIRHEILPKIKTINPEVEKTLAKMSALFNEELAEQTKTVHKYFEQSILKISKNSLVYESGKLYILPKNYQRKVIREGIKRLKGNLENITSVFIDNFLENQLNAIEIKNKKVIVFKAPRPQQHPL